MLNKKLTTTKWIALIMLTAGIALVQLGQVKDTGEEDKNVGNPFIGLMAVLCACCTSGLAGVYFEKILKGSPVSVWARNIHLAGIGIVSGGVGMVVTGDSDKITTDGFFHGYTMLTVAVVLVGALGGMVTAVVIKYADNILKGFATSIAIIISCIVSIIFFDFVLTLKFVMGTACVNYAVYLYGKPAPAPPAPPNP
jgi:UDP-sugar transporter A1/2/3